ncbi:glycosyltransferase [Pediococcus inopinatus]|uniref:glycosyltransferase n=1 Tax=Pediococcus inopinatus TaxID=114090 RepID=UPI002B25C728|nr:glycosyltransferase [Pediococcus inopinatus]WPC18763.1 glycosyltransferase [Pediococcus inopinatus]
MKKAPIRILHFPGSINVSNGRMSVIMNIYRNIDRSMLQFDFAATDSQDSQYTEEIKKLGGKIFLLPEVEKNNLIKIKAFTRSILRNNMYDIVQYHATSPWKVALNVAKKMGVPNIISHSHNSRFGGNWLKSIRNRVFSLDVSRISTKRVACSKRSGHLLFGKNSFEVINNSIDESKYRFNAKFRNEIRSKLKVSDDTILLGQVGRLSAEKNVEFSLNVLYKLKKRSKNVRLVIAGTGELEQTLKRKSEQLGIDRCVTFLGQCNEVEKLYSALDILLMPSIYEGIPMTAIEGQASGLNVLLSNNIDPFTNVGLAKFLDIKVKGLGMWEDEILKMDLDQSKRINANKLLVEHHYDIKNTVNKWQYEYMKMSGIENC